MLKIRPIAALALLPAAALCVGAFGGAAEARPIPAASSLYIPAGSQAAGLTSPAALHVVATRHYGQPGNASGFSVIIATGAGQAWAFGGTNPGGPSTPIAARWNGSTLTSSALPAGLSGFITDASAPAASDIWTASRYGRYVLHWNGAHWDVARQWPSGQITGLTAVSPTDAWVFGTTVTGSRVLGTWHYDGSGWLRVAGLADSIFRASAVSGSDIWAIAASTSADVIVHYDGSAWSRVRIGPVLNGVQPRDILAISSHDVWVAANEVSQSGIPRLVLAHWNGRSWSRLASGLAAWAGRLSPGPHGDVLLTATPANSSVTGLIVHASPQGWGATIVVAAGLGSGVSDVALAPRTSLLWATGGILTRVGGEAAIWSGPVAPPDLDRPTGHP